ncbi:hypothetical protein FNV43_RR23555 [Rhamnella rubrinervis]|uniref:Poly [ADP-ribose] polymerase n=1 Tax=Rhamnella rubrinervis TaxID=2594499 RepID=A0A8K0DWC7_9ROSA|nr:hypothetical protein FNV43_RR23555 [Rhamnella rubrinervis]
MTTERNQVSDVYGDGSVFIVNKKRESNQLSDVYVNKKRERNPVTDVYGDGSVFIVNKMRERNPVTVFYGDDSVFIVDKEKVKDKLPEKNVLDTRVSKFLSVICNVTMMKQHMVQIGYDANKLPFDKLSKSTILKAFEVLRRISYELGHKKPLAELSRVSFAFVNEVDALDEIEAAKKLIVDNTTAIKEEPMFSNYQRLRCELVPLDVNSEEFSMYSSTRNRMLLWHGSPLTNWTSLLSNGFRIDPIGTNISERRFGKAVYFADMFCKSVIYCFGYDAYGTSVSDGVLLLCEVALGDMAEILTIPKHDYKLPEGKLSSKVIGKAAPDLSEVHTMNDGVLVPLGKPKKNEGVQVQVLRLDSAIRQESNKLSNSNKDGSDNKKRKRDSEDHEPNCSETTAQSALRGIITTGSNKQLKEMHFPEDSAKGTDVDIPQANEENNGSKEKIISATNKFAAVVDQWLPNHIKAQYHVLQLGDDIYDAMLNRTNIGANINKFQLIQVLESNDGGKYLVCSRSGRIGSKGRNATLGPYASPEVAIQEFTRIFFKMTKNILYNRKAFVAHPNGYTWLELDYSQTENKSVPIKENPNPARVAKKAVTQLLDTKLDAHVAKFMSLICNISMTTQQMVETEYVANKFPLGKLSKSTILKGYDVLKRIANVIDQYHFETLEKLSGHVTYIIPWIKLKVEELGVEIDLATRLSAEDTWMLDDPLFINYQRLGCELIPLHVDSQEFAMVKKYMHNTYQQQFLNFKVDIVQLFRVSREGEVDRFKKAYAHLLGEGFSLQTCSPKVQVALGDMSNLTALDYAFKPRDGKALSIKIVGNTEPDPSEVHTMEDGVLVPLGMPKRRVDPYQAALNHNEYIVHNEDRIRMRYVVQNGVDEGLSKLKL